MIRATIAFLLTLLLLISAGAVFGAEMAKEGSGEGITYFTSTSQVHVQGKENAVFNYEARGVNASTDETSPFYMASSLCVGSVKGLKGVLKESGLCTITRLDGDQIYMSYEAGGKMGAPMKGTFTLVSGAGKCTGLTGTGEFVRTSLKGPAIGISASFSKTKASWKIPSSE